MLLRVAVRVRELDGPCEARRLLLGLFGFRLFDLLSFKGARERERVDVEAVLRPVPVLCEELVFLSALLAFDKELFIPNQETIHRPNLFHVCSNAIFMVIK